MSIAGNAITAQDLRNAVNLLDKVGLAKGKYVDPPTGACCAFGAVGVARHGYDEDTGLLAGEGCELIAEHPLPGPDSRQLARWNDLPDTTADDVMDWLTVLADRMDAGEQVAA